MQGFVRVLRLMNGEGDVEACFEELPSGIVKDHPMTEPEGT